MAQFDASRAEVSVLLTLTLIGGALTSPLLGTLTDRLGARPVAIVGKVAFALAALALGLVPPSIWTLGLLYLAVGASTSLTVSFTKVLTGWFDRRRGLAISIFSLSATAGAVLIPQLAGWLLPQVGWRITYVVLGALTLAVCPPLLMLWLRERSGGAFAPQTASLQGNGLAGPIWRDPSFWPFALSLPLMRFVEVAVQTHAPAMLQDRGIGGAIPAAAISLTAAGSIVGRLADSVVLDRSSTPRIMLPFVACAAVGLALLFLPEVPVGIALVGAFLFGIGAGAEVGAAPFMLSRYFELSRFGRVFGLLAFINIAASSAAPVAMGLIYDQIGSYQLAVIGLEALLAVACLALLALAPYPTQFAPKLSPSTP